MPTTDYSDGMIREVYPEKCPHCGSADLEI